MLTADDTILGVSLAYWSGTLSLHTYATRPDGERVDFHIHTVRDAAGYYAFREPDDATVVELQRRWNAGELPRIDLDGDFAGATLAAFEHAGHNNPLDPPSKARVASMRQWLRDNPLHRISDRAHQHPEPDIKARTEVEAVALRRADIKKLIRDHWVDARVQLQIGLTAAGALDAAETTKLNNMVAWQHMIATAAGLDANLSGATTWPLIRDEARRSLASFYLYHDALAWADSAASLQQKWSAVLATGSADAPVWSPDTEQTLAGAGDVTMLTETLTEAEVAARLMQYIWEH